MAHKFWLECVNLVRAGDSSTHAAFEAVTHELRHLQEPGKEARRLGQELWREGANLAELIASLAVCSLNCQVCRADSGQTAHVLVHICRSADCCTTGQVL
jgi:hypothetical protein